MAGNSVKRFAPLSFARGALTVIAVPSPGVLRRYRKIILALLRLNFLPRIEVLGANCSHVAVQRIVRD
jgi:hypothetical protein